MSAQGPSALGQNKKDKKDPHEKLETLERASGRGTIVILLGILIEIWAFFYLDEHDPRERLIALIANSLIALGLLIEYAAIRLTITASREAKIEADQEVAAVMQRAAEADQKAAEATLALEQFRAPRARMFQEAGGTKRLETALERWYQEDGAVHGPRFSVACNLNDGEQQELMQALMSALQGVGWDFLHWGTSRDIRQPFGSVSVRGIEIEVSAYNQQCADALAAVLNEIGLKTSVTVRGIHNDIRIMVGSKL